MSVGSALRLGFAALLIVAVAGCTTTPAQFDRNPKGIDRVALCRAFMDSPDQAFRQRVYAELTRRGVNAYDCPAIIQRQNQAAAALVAVALVGTAVAVCANRNCGGGYYRPPPTYPGNCQYPWQRDAAGNRCGDRAASVRPGGW